MRIAPGTGYAALRAGLWEEARSAFEAALETREDPSALEGLSRAVWWLGEHEWSHRCAERAYLRYREKGDGRSAGLYINTPGTHDRLFRAGGIPAADRDFASAPPALTTHTLAAGKEMGPEFLGPPPFR